MKKYYLMIFYSIQANCLKFNYIFNLLKNYSLTIGISNFKMLFLESVQFNALKILLHLIIQFLKIYFRALFSVYLVISLFFI